MRQAFSWWCFADRGVDDFDLLRGAREIGYDGVELIPDGLIDAAHGEGLSIVSRNGHRSIGEGLNDPLNHERIAKEIADSLSLARRYGIENLIVFSGNRRSGLDERAGAEHTAKGLALCAPLAEQAGVTLLLELLNSCQRALRTEPLSSIEN